MSGIGQPREIVFGGERIPFTVERTRRRKTVALSYGADGLRVLAPVDLSDDEISTTVHSKGTWILRKKARYHDLGPIHRQREFVSGEGYSYLGRQYRLRVVRNPEITKPEAKLKSGFLVVQVPDATDGEERRSTARRALGLWYREKASLKLPQRVDHYSNQLGIKPPPVLVRSQEKRWGSCDGDGRLRFNWLVIMAPLSLVDYVVAHELCHLQEHNHSRRFWRLLGTIMPDYETRRERLRTEGLRYFI